MRKTKNKFGRVRYIQPVISKIQTAVIVVIAFGFIIPLIYSTL